MAKSKSKLKSKNTKERIAPLGDRVLVRPLSQEEGMKRPSGIIIPDTIDKERPQEGEVIAVGPGKYDDGKLVPPYVKKGDRVLFSKYGYDEVKIDGVEYFILKEENVLAVLN